jgi:hypothetical protein
MEVKSMRMGAFLLGGIVGAAAVMYWNRNGMMGQVMGKAKTAFSQMNEGGTVNMTDNWSRNSASASNNGLDKVKEIIDQDPELRKQVDEITSNKSEAYMQ